LVVVEARGCNVGEFLLCCGGHSHSFSFLRPCLGW
jgi:hypothetical protein